MGRFSKTRARVREGETLTVRDLQRRGVRIDRLCSATGLTSGMLDSYLAGERQPVPWLARTIAGAIGVKPADLWPARDSDALHRGSLDDHRARRARQENLGRGVSRGGRHTNEEF